MSDSRAARPSANLWWRQFLQLSLLLGIPMTSLSTAYPQSGKPNILFIYLDDLGWRDLGTMGSDFYETPRVDQLASEGMVFTNAYSAAANCAPARACLLTGQYTPRHKIYNVGTQPRGRAEHRRLEHIPGVDVLPDHIPTWAHQIQSVGYRTAIIGKWHLSEDPLPHGFDHNVAGDNRGGPPGGYSAPFRETSDLKDVPNGSYLTDILTQSAINYIRNNQSVPWLLYLSHFAVHTPFQSRHGRYDCGCR